MGPKFSNSVSVLQVGIVTRIRRLVPINVLLYEDVFKDSFQSTAFGRISILLLTLSIMPPVERF